jgi:hypothetical protein
MIEQRRRLGYRFLQGKFVGMCVEPRDGKKQQAIDSGVEKAQGNQMFCSNKRVQSDAAPRPVAARGWVM